jgi:hypothetical protein
MSKLTLISNIGKIMEKIKIKITSQEYDEILENLQKIELNDVEDSDIDNEDSDIDNEDSDIEKEETLNHDYVNKYNNSIALSEVVQLIKKINNLPNVELIMWNGKNLQKRGSSSFGIGLFIPSIISSKLATFLQIPENVFVFRSIVTRYILNYIKIYKLQKENIRFIDLTKPGGEALAELLSIPEGVELSYFNLEKYLKPHYKSISDDKNCMKI